MREVKKLEILVKSKIVRERSMRGKIREIEIKFVRRR